jgi:hypothetical protein
MPDKQTASTVPPDDLRRKLTAARAESGENIPHIGLAGDTYTILLTGKDTAGQFCLIDMHVPPEAALLRTGTISRRRSPSSKANSK